MIQRAFEQSFGERNTQFYHFLVVTLPTKLLQEKVSVLSAERLWADEERVLRWVFSHWWGEHADLGTAAGTAVGTVLLVSSHRLLETFMLPWEWSKEPFFKHVQGDFSLGEVFVSSLEST